MIILSGETPFATGYERRVFVHPQNPNRCLKITHTDIMESLKRKKPIRSRLYSAAYYDPARRELKCARYVAKKGYAAILLHLPKYYGIVQTDLGAALECELIRNADGGISKTLHDCILEEGYTDAIAAAFAEFVADVFSGDKSSKSFDELQNYMVQILPNGSRRIYFCEYRRNFLFPIFGRREKRKRELIELFATIAATLRERS